jgi:ankyrin repeat protein
MIKKTMVVALIIFMGVGNVEPAHGMQRSKSKIVQWIFGVGGLAFAGYGYYKRWQRVQEARKQRQNEFKLWADELVSRNKRERIEREERVQREQKRLEQEVKERLERERLEKLKKEEQAQRERERVEKERLERERLERERVEREREIQAIKEFFAAVEANDLDGVDKACVNKIPLDVLNDAGETLLHVACRKGHFKIAHVLLDKGLGVDTKDRDGRTAFYVACMWRGWRAVTFLCRAKADIDAPDSKDGTNPLLWACRNNDFDMVRYLVEHRANKDVRDNAGYTPLLTAWEKGYSEIFTFLVQQGANVNVYCGDKPPLLWACDEGRLGLFTFLLAHGADCTMPGTYHYKQEVPQDENYNGSYGQQNYLQDSFSYYTDSLFTPSLPYSYCSGGNYNLYYAYKNHLEEEQLKRQKLKEELTQVKEELLQVQEKLLQEYSQKRIYTLVQKQHTPLERACMLGRYDMVMALLYRMRVTEDDIKRITQTTGFKKNVSALTQIDILQALAKNRERWDSWQRERDAVRLRHAPDMHNGTSALFKNGKLGDVIIHCELE